MVSVSTEVPHPDTLTPAWGLSWIASAAEVVHRYLPHTPLVRLWESGSLPQGIPPAGDVSPRSPLSDSESSSRGWGGAEIWLKLETLQPIGAFKIRGALAAVANAARRGVRHVVTPSSGNHGRAVAYAARLFGLKATVVVPETIPAVKREAIAALGAEIVQVGGRSSERLVEAEHIAAERGAEIVYPYDDPWVVAGQGTLALELYPFLREGDVLLVPVGGGGLIAGIATAVKARFSRVRVVGVEPEGADDTRRSLEAGTRVRRETVETMADGLRAEMPGAFTFPLVQRYADALVTVSEEEIAEALRRLFWEARIVAEPSGAVSLAGAFAVREGRGGKAAAPGDGGRLVAVISGGNVDPELFCSLIRRQS
ncbi:MAG TPA: threonine/serine dehydratase [Bacillaceae bacterium]|nr:threonine/serine dehydratase [Bacillaceae bacterium]